MLPSTNKPSSENNSILEKEITRLQEQLAEITQKTEAFEAILKNKLANEFIQVQELTTLYKQLQKAKKEKRLEQKKKGKNYVEPTKIIKTESDKKSIKEESLIDIKEKKKLYKEAMLLVHPDKFAIHNQESELATKLTTQLIEIYNNEDLKQLKAFHAYITLGHATTLNKSQLNQLPTSEYLLQEKERLEQELKKATKKHTYKVLTTYKDPMSFINELKVYFDDKIMKLKKRTRKAN